MISYPKFYLLVRYVAASRVSEDMPRTSYQAAGAPMFSNGRIFSDLLSHSEEECCSKTETEYEGRHASGTSKQGHPIQAIDCIL